MLNFKPIVDLPLYKKLGEPSSLVECALASHSYSGASVKILGVQHLLGTKIWFSEKVDLIGVIAPLNLRNWWTN